MTTASPISPQGLRPAVNPDDEPAGLTIPPLAYGYLRVPADMPDQQVKAMEDQLMDYADQLGCRFGGFFFEFRGGLAAAFNDLLEELRRTRAPYVIVPSLRHVAHHRLLREIRLSSLESDTGTQVLDLSARTGRGAVAETFHAPQALS